MRVAHAIVMAQASLAPFSLHQLQQLCVQPWCMI